ncbi:MAG: hypothetical protein HRT88_20290, partial [Lentisphaeraceae bacterium]|nr:hypothetical protein [Lentisphaeraceae bacterium]
SRHDYYHVYLNQFSGSSLDVLLYCFIDCDDWAIELRERQRLFMDIIRLAARLEVQFAYPTQTLHVAQKEDLHKTVLSTSVEDISTQYELGRKQGAAVMQDSLAGRADKLPQEINYDQGNPFIHS